MDNQEQQYTGNEATVQQRRKFFALVHDMGYEADQMKERAKAKYGLSSFRFIQKDQINELIDALQTKFDAEFVVCPQCKGTGYTRQGVA
jgi:hypothetical protein